MNTEQIDEIALSIWAEIGAPELNQYGRSIPGEFARRLVAEIQARNEPVAYIERHKAGNNIGWDRIDHPYAAATPLYTFPPDCEELRKDAERYQWLRDELEKVEHPLSQFINSAGINANDLPHVVVEKLERAMLRAAPQPENKE